MHEQVASAVVIANALLDNFDIHTIAQDLPQARSYFRIFTSNSPSELRTSPWAGLCHQSRAIRTRFATMLM